MNQSIWIRTLLVASIAVTATAGCGNDDRPSVETVECEDNRELNCVDGTCSVSGECGGETPLCLQGLGCVSCLPGEPVCSGDNAYICGQDGQPEEQVEECRSGNCVDGECAPYCDMGDSRSYLGCQFVAVTTMNGPLGVAFREDFAVIVGNPGAVAAKVTVSQRNRVLEFTELPPGGVEAIQLPMEQSLVMAEGSGTAARAAYFVNSTEPVVAYQFNPLHYQTTEGGEFSTTNDASLLLPLHTLTGSYRVNSWPTHGAYQRWGWGSGSEWSWIPGFAAVAAVEDSTIVTLSFADSSDTLVVELDKGDVYQVASAQPPTSVHLRDCEEMGGTLATSGYCPSVPDTDSETEPDTDTGPCLGLCSLEPADLTGMKIDANRPVGVIAGHSCTFMPFDQWACDHLEEMMLPLDSWGKGAVMTAPVHPNGISSGVSEAYYRVLADQADTQVSFVPEVAAPVTLGVGEFYEFHTDQDFEVSANRRIHITQTFVGQDATGSEIGDPAMGTGIPVAQSRGDYVFLVPETYTDNYVNMVAATGAVVTLDDAVVTDWTPIAGTAYSVARVRLEPGSHRVATEDDRGLTITSYGYAWYTSYLFPGGMNVVSVPL